MKTTSINKPLAIILLLSIIGSNGIKAQSGSLDLSFDTDGKVTTTIGNAADVGSALAIQSDGKIVVAGYSDNDADTDFAVVRYHPDGSLDTDFGTNGKVTTDIGGYDDVGNSIAIQDDGKIVVAGYGRSGTNKDVAVLRYNDDGSLDTSFDDDGIVTTAIGNSSDYGFAVAIQSDGKIVVAGSSSNAIVVRYQTDGSLDNTFDGDGIVIIDINNASEALSIALQSDGKIVVAGYYNDIYTDMVVVRLNEDGSLDQSFDGDGIVTQDINGLNDKAYSVAIQSDDKIVVAGLSYAGLDMDYALVRYNADGTLDDTFHNDGIVTTNIGSFDESARAMVLQDDGKILVTGIGIIGTSSYVVVVRYNSNGTLDLSFDADGIVTTNIGSLSEGQSIKLQSDGKIVVSGYAQINGNLDFAVARYNNIGISNIHDTKSDFNALNLSPNPCTNQTILSMAKPFEHANLHLYNTTGQTVKQIENISGTTYTLQLIDLPSGIYHLVMAENGKTVGCGSLVVE